jgi:hypothetical protein
MTRRSNEERLGFPQTGAKDPSDAPPVIGNTDEAPTDILSYVSPTELVDLPSEGKFYVEGHPLHNQTTIEIREMTAKQEDILTSKSLIQKGIVLDRLLQSVIVNKEIKVEDLLVGDKNALLVSLRISGYGREYTTKVACPSCNETDKFEFDLADSKIIPPFDLENCDNERMVESVTSTPDGNYLIRLPKTGMEAEVRLLTGRDERRVLALQEMKKKKKLPENALTEHFRLMIVSIGGIDDKIQVHKFIEVMPASDSRFLRKTFQKLTPNIDLTQEFVCDSCGYEQEIEVPFTTDFFWPDA